MQGRAEEKWKKKNSLVVSSTKSELKAIRIKTLWQEVHKEAIPPPPLAAGTRPQPGAVRSSHLPQRVQEHKRPAPNGCVQLEHHAARSQKGKAQVAILCHHFHDHPHRQGSSSARLKVWGKTCPKACLLSVSGFSQCRLVLYCTLWLLDIGCFFFIWMLFGWLFFFFCGLTRWSYIWSWCFFDLLLVCYLFLCCVCHSGFWGFCKSLFFFHTLMFLPPPPSPAFHYVTLHPCTPARFCNASWEPGNGVS